MAFNFKTFAAVGALIGSLALVGCGQDEKDPNHIKVGVIVGAEQQVAEVAQKVAKEKYGLDVELVTFNDYVLPNEALSKGDIDANAFQHKPYLDQQIKDRGYKLEYTNYKSLFKTDFCNTVRCRDVILVLCLYNKESNTYYDKCS